MDIRIHLMILMCLVIIVNANKNVNNTLEYFKTVGIEIARLLCNNLDMILESFGENDNKVGDN